ncbi:hypothetical protein Aduo_001534 [Ancylostoma duodenale]
MKIEQELWESDRSSIPRHLVLSEADDAGPPHTIEENYIDGDVEEVEDTLVGEDVQTASSSVHGLEESTSTSEMFGDITDELLFAFARHTSQGLSNDAVRMSYTEALYMSNGGLRFGYDDEKKLSDRMNLLARVDEKFYCAKCDGQLQTSTTRCNNLGYLFCFSLPCKRFRNLRHIQVHVCDVAVQIRTITGLFLKDIIDIHRVAHFVSYGGQKPDSRFQERFRHGIESRDEFVQNKLKVQLILNTDGYKMKGLLRAQSWPFYVSIWDLSPKRRSSKYAVAICGCITGCATPSETNIARVLSALHGFIACTQSEGIPFLHDNVQWRISYHVTASLLDSEAVMKVYHIKCWTGKHGCPRCHHPAVYRNHSWRYPLEHSPSAARTKSDVDNDSTRARHGFTGPGIMNTLVPVNLLLVDGLHIIDEGILANLLRDVFGKDKSFNRCFRVSNSVIEMLYNALCAVELPTYARSIWDVKDVKTMCGAEVYQASTALVPLMAAICAMPDCRAAVIATAICVISRWLDSFELSTSSLAACKNLTTLTQSLYQRLLGDTYATFKAHLFFAHCATDMQSVGSPFELTTAMFESLHRSLRAELSQHNTRGAVSAALRRHQWMICVHSEVVKRANRVVLLATYMLSSVQFFNQHRKRCMKSVAILAYVATTEIFAFEN